MKRNDHCRRRPALSTTFLLLMALAIGAFAGTRALAGKPSGGGGGGTGGGTIYFVTQDLTWTMNSDGSVKTALPAVVRSEPSRLLHGGHRWFLDFRATAGEIQPNGQPRYDLLAVRDDGATVRRLTYQADLIVHGEMRWSPGDAVISWRGARWVGGSRVDDGFYTAIVEFDGSGEVTGLASQPASVSVPAAYSTSGHDWSPDATRLVFADPSHALWIGDLSSGTPTRLGTALGGDPAWSPDGTRIAYSGDGRIRTVAPDGSQDVTLVSRKPSGAVQIGLSSPEWSPGGTHLVYLQSDMNYGARWDTYRIAASGSGRTNLTADLDTRVPGGNGGAIPLGWR